MLPLIRTLLCVFSVFVSAVSFAGIASVRPVSPFSQDFYASVKKLDAGLGHDEIARHRPAKICSCQILNMQSANYIHNRMAVFAEKTNDGRFAADSRIAKDAIEKEKKHLKRFFYDKMQVVNDISEATDCNSLYTKLKGADHSLVMYDILDADVRR